MDETDDWTALGDRTWMQLRECTYLAMAALKKVDSDEARTVLARIERVLTEGAHMGRPEDDDPQPPL